MVNTLETHRKHPVRPFIITLIGMIVVFGSFLLLLLLSGDGGSGKGAGGGRGAGLGSGIGTGTGTGSGGGDGSGSGLHAGAASGAVQPQGTGGGSRKAGTKTMDGRQPAEKPAEKPAASGRTVPPENASAVPGPAAPVQPPRPLIPYQVPSPANAPAPGTDAADSGPASYGTGSGGGGGGGTFYGVRSLGNTLYIVDTSSSMGTPTTEGPARIEILKQQLVNAVRGRHRKESSDKYSVISFNSNIQLFPANGRQVRFLWDDDTRKLRTFAQSLSPCGSTSMMTAWQEAVRQLGKHRIDTVCFLTDGEPTDCSMPDLINYIQQNVSAKTVIHTIVIGMENPELRDLAGKYNGTYRSIR